MARSFHNKILRVNLTEGTVTIEEPGESYLRHYFGGWNIIADILLREVPANGDPLGPENKLVFAPGVLSGLPLSGAARNAIGAKSPLTGAFGAAEVGGFWGAELKRAGFDAVIVEGASDEPIYLWINDGEAELRDASALWGKRTKETESGIREELDDDGIRCAMIGPAGENMVRYACIMNGLKDAGGRTGLGAVMGSKKLKAIAVRGTMDISGVDADRIREMARDMGMAVREGEKAESLHEWGTGVGLEGSVLTGNLPIRNFRDGEFEGAGNISAENYMPEIGIGMEGCYACAVRCKKVVDADSPYDLDSDYGGPEYESAAALGSCCGVDDVVAVSKATELCNANSLDSIGTGVVIAFAMECFENGLLTLEDTDGIELHFGNGDALVKMVEKIAQRDGLGDLLANDLQTIAEEIGGEAEQFAMHVKGQPYPMHEPRFKRGLAIGYAVSPTGADHVHALHDSGLVEPDEDGFMPNETLRTMGILDAIPLEDLGPEKVRATLYNTIASVTLNCLTTCLFVPWTAEELVEIARAATGWDVSAYELLKVGERALTLARVFNVREGFDVSSDRLAERSYGPTTSGALADGGIDREVLHEALQNYYGMIGWDEESGVPTVAKLHELGVSWAVDYLPDN
ncbi:MAG: aldehyde ferredoxin oxidoreductase family protein [Anaerolineae bacterium]